MPRTASPGESRTTKVLLATVVRTESETRLVAGVVGGAARREYWPSARAAVFQAHVYGAVVSVQMSTQVGGTGSELLEGDGGDAGLGVRGGHRDGDGALDGGAGAHDRDGRRRPVGGRADGGRGRVEEV